MWFEKPFLWLTVLERHVLLPVFFLDVLTRDSPVLVTKFGLSVGTLLSVICSKYICWLFKVMLGRENRNIGICLASRQLVQ